MKGKYLTTNYEIVIYYVVVRQELKNKKKTNLDLIDVYELILRINCLHDVLNVPIALITLSRF